MTRSPPYWPAMPTATALLLLALAIAVPARGAPVAVPPPHFLLAPVLNVAVDELAADEAMTSDASASPAARTFGSWGAYAASFVEPALDDLHASLAHALGQLDLESVAFLEYGVVQRPPTWKLDRHDGLIAVWDPERHLTTGRVYLLAVDDAGAPCGASTALVLVSFRDVDDPRIAACALYNTAPPADRRASLFLAPITTTSAAALHILTAARLRLHDDRFGGDRLAGGPVDALLTGPSCGRAAIACDAGIAGLRGVVFDEFAARLDDAQRRAVQASLAAVEHRGAPVLIDGPSGDDRSACVVALLRVLLSQSQRVLLTAPTNAAVRAVAARTIRAAVADGVAPHSIVIIDDDDDDDDDDPLGAYRVDVRARLILSAACAALDQLRALIVCADADADAVGLADRAAIEQAALHDIRGIVAAHWFQSSLASLAPLATLLADVGGGAGGYDAVRAGVARLERLARDARLVAAIADELAAGASLVFATLTATSTARIVAFPFEVAVVNDGARVPEADLLALFKASLRALVLVGDAQSVAGRRNPRSLFARLSASAHPVHRLGVPHRSLRAALAPTAGRLRFDARALCRLRSFVVGRPRWISERFPALQLFVHETTCGHRFLDGSWANAGEAQLIVAHLDQFFGTIGTDPLRIGVVAPYAAQRRELKEQIDRLPQPAQVAIDVCAMDGFAGRDYDVVVVSLTHTTQSPESLARLDRADIDLTRGKHALWVFGDQVLFAPPAASIWSVFADHCERVGALVQSPKKSNAGRDRFAALVGGAARQPDSVKRRAAARTDPANRMRLLFGPVQPGRAADVTSRTARPSGVRADPSFPSSIALH